MILLLLLLIMGMVPVAAEQDVEPTSDYLTSVFDADDLLSDAEEQKINAAFAKASEEMGIPVCAFVFRYVGHDVWGDDVLDAYGLDGEEIDLVLFVVENAYGEYNCYMYTYGDAEYKIDPKEVDYILHDSEVYDNIKDTGDVASGLCACAALSTQAYNGRLGVSWVIILVIALVIGAIAGGLSVAGVRASYKRKNPSTSYPLDRFAKLELTHSDDREIGKFVTHTIISTGGGRGGRGGGGRRGGGGGGGFRGGI